MNRALVGAVPMAIGIALVVGAVARRGPPDRGVPDGVLEPDPPTVPGPIPESKAPNGPDAASPAQEALSAGAVAPVRPPEKDSGLEDLLQRIGLDLRTDAVGNPVPVPPPEYLGTQLHWRLKHPILEEHVSELLRHLRRLRPMERQSVLQKVRWGRSPVHGRALLEEIPNITFSPVTLFQVASALIETTRGTRLLEQGRPSSHRASRLFFHGPGGIRPIRDRTTLPSGSPPIREQGLAALSLLARKVEEYGSVMGDSEWSGIRSKLEEFLKYAPEVFEAPEAEASLDGIRKGLVEALGKAIGRGSGGYLAGEHGFRLAEFLAGRQCSRCAGNASPPPHRCPPTAFLAARSGSEELHSLMLELLRDWDGVVRRLGPDRHSIIGSSLLMTMQALLDPPCALHGREAATLVAGIPSRGEPIPRVVELVDRFARRTSIPEDLRAILRQGARVKPGPAGDEE